MRYYNLKNKEYINKKENKGLEFLYNNIIGRLVLKFIISKPIRQLYIKYICSKFSKTKIKKFIKQNNINLSEYEEKEYNCFNDFFIRNIKPSSRKIEDGIIAISDSKLTILHIDENSCFKIKNSIYTVNELIGENSEKYVGGSALIFRLAVDDYHHYVFPDDGKIIRSKKIDGVFHSVQPIAYKKYKVFHENFRTVTFLDCKNLGEVCYVEVGAMMIGRIVNRDITEFKKGEEKGYFEFGGSTIIVLLQKDKASFNSKIIKNSEEEIETVVKLGQKIS